MMEASCTGLRSKSVPRQTCILVSLVNGLCDSSQYPTLKSTCQIGPHSREPDSRQHQTICTESIFELVKRRTTRNRYQTASTNDVIGYNVGKRCSPPGDTALRLRCNAPALQQFHPPMHFLHPLHDFVTANMSSPKCPPFTTSPCFNSIMHHRFRSAGV